MSKVIDVREFGVVPDSAADAVPGIAAALAACRQAGMPVTLRFPTGRIDLVSNRAQTRYFPMSNTDVLPQRTVGILLENVEDLTLEGDQTELVLHGAMTAIALARCRNITLHGLIVDTDPPCNAEARVISATSTRIDLHIDPDTFPFVVRGGRLVFVAGDSSEPWAGECMEFEPQTRRVRPGSGDWVLGVGRYACMARQPAPGRVTLNGVFSHLPMPGNILVLRHGKRSHAGIYMQGCSKINCVDVEMHGNKGLGILAQDCSDLTFRRIACVPAPGRIAAGHDDGLHISNCRGEIFIENCRFAGLMDDPINVHGTSVKVTALRGGRIRARFMHPQSIDLPWAHPGDEVAVLERAGLAPVAHAIVKQMHRLNARSFELELDQTLIKLKSTRLALENLSAAPSVTIRNCHFEPCRARGLLISTPRPSLIEGCTFDSSGSAILVAGDANYWWESGAVGGLTIRGNTFSGLCNSSAYQFCEAIISICPSLPHPDVPFHGHIRVEGNTFTTGGDPLLYTLSVREVEFTGNTINYSADCPARLPGKALLILDACGTATIQANIIDPQIRNAREEIKRMTLAQVESEMR